MKKPYHSRKYITDVEAVTRLELPWERLANSRVFISGASGMIGSSLIDVLMRRNRDFGLNAEIYAVSRNKMWAGERFAEYRDEKRFTIISHDINYPFEANRIQRIDYIFHLASNTHPVAYASDPVGTITANIIGTKNLLDLAVEKKTARFLFASSNEIYGENRGDKEKFDEAYCGYIDPNTLRAGYPESKRCGEAMCQAYRRQFGVESVIARLTRSYGPTLLENDSKAMSQFLRNGVRGEDIVLKSKGDQFYSYTYVTDAVSGLLTVMLCGTEGEAYNVAHEESDIRLKDLAGIIADHTGGKVVFEIPDDIEKAGFSKATKARLDGGKLTALGWKPEYDIEKGVKRTLDIMREVIG